jgi:16S rRNA A1518/A1519 N6-dimethyltransferase RsmA/KsgA/DIM1 with predicted DNA glycosylase/AP lyase activity
MGDKRMRKTLSKKLNALQTNPSRWIHEMDDDMLESISEMLKSDDNTNVNMAKDIVFKSKLNYNQIRYLVNNFLYKLTSDTTTDTIKYYDAG